MRFKLIALVLISFAIPSCVENEDVSNYLKIGAIIPNENLPDSGMYFLLYNSSSFINSYSYIYDGIEYDIGGSYDKDSNLIVTMISTSDTSFITSDGLKTGDLLNDAIKLSKEKIKIDPGWGYFLLLPSGWYAGFFPDYQFYAQTPIYDTTRISWFFKKDIEWFATDSVIIKSINE